MPRSAGRETSLDPEPEVEQRTGAVDDSRQPPDRLQALAFASAGGRDLHHADHGRRLGCGDHAVDEQRRAPVLDAAVEEGKRSRDALSRLRKPDVGDSPANDRFPAEAAGGSNPAPLEVSQPTRRQSPRVDRYVQEVDIRFAQRRGMTIVGGTDHALHFERDRRHLIPGQLPRLDLGAQLDFQTPRFAARKYRSC